MDSGEVDEHLDDAETVYRRVLPGQWTEQGGVRHVSVRAFQDRQQEPSVDRALLCGTLGPAHTQEGPENAVVSLNVGRVRGLTPILVGGPKPSHPKSEYETDVVSRPLETNKAHCVVLVRPGDRPKAYQKMIERLALMASFELVPDNG